MSDTLEIDYNGYIYHYDQTNSWFLDLKVLKFRENLQHISKYDSWFSEMEALLYLKQAGLIPLNHEGALKNYIDKINNSKIQIYEQRFNSKDVEKIRKEIRKTEDSYFRLLNTIHSLDYLTLKGFLDWECEIFVLEQRIKEDISLDISSFRNTILTYLPTLEEVRDLAKSEVWRSLWSAKKEFFTSNSNTTELFIKLLNFSKFYDSIYEHPDHPEEKFIQDNDMLDGWLAREQKKREKEKLEEEINSKLPATKTPGDVFYKTRSPEEAAKINELNSPRALAMKKARVEMAKKKGAVTDMELLKNERQ